MTRNKQTRDDDLADLVLRVQNAYPQIYLACHVDHARRRDSASSTTSADASILAHLDFSDGTTPGALARHMGIAASSLSARVKHLEALGYILRTKAPKDGRVARLTLTPAGRQATAAASVLDRSRVKELLGLLEAGERNEAVRGMAVLALAAARMSRRRTKPILSRQAKSRME